MKRLAGGGGGDHRRIKRGDPPTGEGVIAKLKDDGDFDALRLKIVREVKENKELRKTIVRDVKQSVILNTDGSEDLKPRQLSDAIYQELGRKIMGQISDEVWMVIKSDSINNYIRGTVETVYKKLVNPEEGNGDLIHSSPAKEQPISKKTHKVPPVAVSACEIDVPDGAEPMEPPGYVQCDQQSTHNNKPVHKELVSDDQLCLQRNKELRQSPDAPHPSEAVLPGFDGVGNSIEVEAGVSDEDPDVPPGFG